MNFILISFMLSTQMVTPSSEDYIKYYNLTNQAQIQYDRKEFKEALSNIRIAFKCVTYVHNAKLILGAEVSSKLRDYKLTHSYLEKAFAQGVLKEDIEKDSIYNEFRTTSYYNKLKANYSSLRNQYQAGINNQYSDYLDSLYYVDQFVIRKSTEEPTKKYQIVKDEHSNIVNDSAVFIALMDLIKKYGFPTERSVRRESLRGAYIMILHSVRMPANQSYLVELKDLLKEGSFHPFYYAWTYDQAMKINKKELFYYCGMPYDKSRITEPLLQEINEHRKEIGLELLELPTAK